MLARGEVEGSVERRDDALCRPRGRGLVGDLLDQHHELVAAEARDRVCGPQHRSQARRDAREQLISRSVPEAVVDELEVVDVQQHDRELGGRLGECAAQAVEEQGPVRQPRQRVVGCLVADVIFHGALLDRVGENVCERLREVHIRGAERATACVREPQHPPAALPARHLAGDTFGELIG